MNLSFSLQPFGENRMTAIQTLRLPCVLSLGGPVMTLMISTTDCDLWKEQLMVAEHLFRGYAYMLLFALAAFTTVHSIRINKRVALSCRRKNVEDFSNTPVLTLLESLHLNSPCDWLK